MATSLTATTLTPTTRARTARSTTRSTARPVRLAVASPSRSTNVDRCASSSRSRAIAMPARALPPLAEIADTETVLLTYGSIGFFLISFGVLAYRSFGSMVFGPTATASHVLVKDSARAEALKREIEDEVAAGAPLREKFAKTAEVHSTCPSAKKGGELGTFKPGQMVKEFDAVVFGGDVGRVLGPVDTRFGSHLILVTDREEST